MKIGLLGCGAMGSLYGGYLSKVHEVYVCDVWKEHIEAIRANGIRLDEPEGETAVFTPKYATTDPSEIGPADRSCQVHAAGGRAEKRQDHDR